MGVFMLKTLENPCLRGIEDEIEDFAQKKKHVSKNIYFIKHLPQVVPCGRCLIKLTLSHTYHRVLPVVGV